MKKTAKMRYVDMRLGDIRIPANYPRTDNTGDMLLALSICEQGNITPIIVDAKGFLISGKRRFKEMRRKKYRSTKVLVRDDIKDPNHRYVTSVIETMHSKELEGLDKANAFVNIMKILNINSQRELARRLRISKTTVEYHMKLLELPSETKKLLRDGKIRPYTLENVIFKKRIKTHEDFIDATDEQKFESVLKRLVPLKSDISYGIFDKEALDVIREKLDEILRIIDTRLREMEKK